MSIRLQGLFDDPSRIVDESGAQLPLNASTRRVLICLAGYIQPGGTPAHRASAWPAQATLALHAGVSYDTVTRVLQRAERLGLLLAAKQFWTESRRGHRREQAPNRYTFHKATLAAAGAGRVLCVPRRGLVWDTLDRMAIKNRTHYIDRRHAEQNEEPVTAGAGKARAGAASSSPPTQNAGRIEYRHNPPEEQCPAPPAAALLLILRREEGLGAWPPPRPGGMPLSCASAQVSGPRAPPPRCPRLGGKKVEPEQCEVGHV